MTAEVERQTDWREWLRRWDAQQTGYTPDREGRFAAMFNVLDVLLPDSFVVLDLASGPGSISERLLARFPAARAIALDVDPVLLAIGQGALGTVDGRLRWVDADLAAADWVERLGESQLDAVLSTTALHWLGPDVLVEVYRALGRLVRPGGVVMNGDNMAFGPDLPAFRQLAEASHSEWSDEAFAARGIETWEKLWDDMGRDEALAPLVAERERRFAAKTRPTAPIFDFHVAALRDAGFREVGTVWQSLTNRVLLAVR